MQRLDGLVNDLNRRIDVRGGHKLRYLVGNFLRSERLVDPSHYIFRMEMAGTLQFLTMLVVFLKAILASAFSHQFDGRAEGDEVPQFAHVDAVAVGVPDLRSGGYD